MVIINTQTKSWETDVVLLSNVHFEGEGITVQTDSNKNYAYFFGGQGMTVEGVEYNNHLYVLDLKNNNWLTTINQWDFGVTVKSRYLASSAIINDTFITVFGNILQILTLFMYGTIY